VPTGLTNDPNLYETDGVDAQGRGKPRMRTTMPDIDVEFSGLSKDFKITTIEITDTPSKIPPDPLDDRNSLTFRNLSETEILFFGKSDVEAVRTVGGKGGYEVPPTDGFNTDIKNNLELYGVAETGKTIIVKVLETA
jgi:hypothetical protein